jgi:hypothetical protein
MKQPPWDRDLPEFFHLTAESCFSTNTKNQVWILHKDRGNPPALVIQSDPDNYNGKYKIFPRFREGNQIVSDPAEFSHSPRLNDFFVNLVEYSYYPLDEIRITGINWVPDPAIVCGVIRFHNQSNQTRTIFLDLVGNLAPLETGKRMTVTVADGREILSGQLGAKFPVLFMSGNTTPGKGPYPCLSSELILSSDTEVELRWISALGDSTADSMGLVNAVNQLDWGTEFSRLKIAAQSQLQIITGNPEWNYAFALSQKEASGYICRNSNYDETSPELIQPLTAFKALYLMNVLTPVESLTVQMILKKVLGAIEEDGLLPEESCDGFSDLPALPLAAELVWKANQISPDIVRREGLLDQVESGLTYWFLPDSDLDRDGIPEVAHPCQLNLIDIRPSTVIPMCERSGITPFLESPGLGSLLYNDLTRLKGLKSPDEQSSADDSILLKQGILKDFLLQSWNPEQARFLNRDRDSHQTSQGKILFTGSRIGFQILREEIAQPSRISFLIRWETQTDFQPEIRFTLHGRDQTGKYLVERIKSSSILWLNQSGWTASSCIYSQLDYVNIESQVRDYTFSISCLDTTQEDITLLLPLWGKVLKAKDANKFIRKTLSDPDKFWSPFGIRSYPNPDYAVVQIPWNVLVGQGLLNYQKQGLAADLFSRLMKSVLINLNASGCFFTSYNSKTGAGIGSQNTLEGLVPIGFFLQTLGIQIINEREIVIEGNHPFPWPVILRYHGFVINRDKDQTRIDFPGEKTIVIRDPERRCIRMFQSSS